MKLLYDYTIKTTTGTINIRCENWSDDHIGRYFYKEGGRLFLPYSTIISVDSVLVQPTLEELKEQLDDEIELTEQLRSKMQAVRNLANEWSKNWRKKGYARAIISILDN